MSDTNIMQPISILPIAKAEGPQTSTVKLDSKAKAVKDLNELGESLLKQSLSQCANAPKSGLNNARSIVKAIGIRFTMYPVSDRQWANTKMSKRPQLFLRETDSEPMEFVILGGTSRKQAEVQKLIERHGGGFGSATGETDVVFLVDLDDLDKVDINIPFVMDADFVYQCVRYKTLLRAEDFLLRRPDVYLKQLKQCLLDFFLGPRHRLPRPEATSALQSVSVREDDPNAAGPSGLRSSASCSELSERRLDRRGAMSASQPSLPRRDDDADTARPSGVNLSESCPTLGSEIIEHELHPRERVRIQAMDLSCVSMALLSSDEDEDEAPAAPPISMYHRKWDVEDVMILLQYIIDNNLYQYCRHIKMFQEIVKAGILPGRTAQALQQKLRKVVRGMRHGSYGLSDEIINRFKAIYINVLGSDGSDSHLQISETKATGEVKVLEAFCSMLQNDPAYAFYCKRAAAQDQAVETLLISDKLFSCQDIAMRKEYINLIESVRDSSRDMKIFSSMHISGEQLDQLTGIAAILCFPMPELEDENTDEDNRSEEED